MLSDNTHRLTWMAITIGVVASLGTGALALYPQALDIGKSLVVNEVANFTNSGSTDKDENTIFTWSYSGNEATVTGFISGKDSATVTIPKYREVNGKKYLVTGIGNSAFQSYVVGPNMQMNHVPITKLVLPDTLTSIGASAFSGNAIEHVDLPASLTLLDSGAFSNNNLKSIDIPSGIKTLTYSVFSQNTSLSHVTIPDTVTVIQASAFYNDGLTSLTLPNSVSSIENDAFSHNQIGSLVLPNSVKSVGSFAFAYNKLQMLTLSTGMTEIVSDSFKRNQLKSVNIPNSITKIGDNAFQYNSFETITIPKSVLSIGDYAFNGTVDGDSNNGSLQKVTLKNPNTIFEQYTFPASTSIEH